MELEGRRIGDEGRYEFGPMLGYGSMGMVYLGHDHRMGVRVVLKVLNPQLSHLPRIRERFAQEAMLQARLRHPNIVRAMDAVQDGDILAIVMDCIEGGRTLEAWREEQGGHVPLPRIRALLDPVMDAMHFVHQQGIVHRDLKPSNILVDRSTGQDVALVTDFGVAKLLSQDGSLRTATGATLGTPSYMPPEQLKGTGDVDRRADVFALGVLLYQLVTDHLPFGEGSEYEVTFTILSGRRPPEATLLVPGLPAAFDTLIERATAFDREQRYATVADLRADLDAVVDGRPLRPMAPPAPPPPPPADQPTQPPRASAPTPPPPPPPARATVLESAGSPGSVPVSTTGLQTKHKVGIVAAILLAGLLVLGAATWNSRIRAGQKAQAAASLAAPAMAPTPVDFTVHVMSQCPFAVQLENNLKAVVDKLGGTVNLKLLFIGDEPSPGTFTSMHGDGEVKGDLLMVCAQKLFPSRFLDLVVCMNRNAREIPNNFDACATETKVDGPRIRTCANGDQGKTLLSASFKASKDKGARGSPTMFLADRKYEGGRTEPALMRAICDQFQAGKPEACNNLPEPKRIPLTVLSDIRCKDCTPDRIVGQLKNMFPGLEPTTLDYGSTEGRALYERVKDQGARLLPAFLFAPIVTEDPGYSQIQRFITDAGEYKLLQIGAKFNPRLNSK